MGRAGGEVAKARPHLCTTDGKRAFEHTLEGTIWH